MIACTQLGWWVDVCACIASRKVILALAFPLLQEEGTRFTTAECAVCDDSTPRVTDNLPSFRFLSRIVLSIAPSMAGAPSSFQFQDAFVIPATTGIIVSIWSASTTAPIRMAFATIALGSVSAK